MIYEFIKNQRDNLSIFSIIIIILTIVDYFNGKKEQIDLITHGLLIIVIIVFYFGFLIKRPNERDVQVYKPIDYLNERKKLIQYFKKAGILFDHNSIEYKSSPEQGNLAKEPRMAYWVAKVYDPATRWYTRWIKISETVLHRNYTEVTFQSRKFEDNYYAYISGSIKHPRQVFPEQSYYSERTTLIKGGKKEEPTKEEDEEEKENDEE